MLTLDNYSKGFLVDDEAIAGITRLDDASNGGVGLYAAYVSHYLTGETLEYREFNEPDQAIAFLNALPRPWAYEAVGCSAKTGKTKSSGCGSGGCGSGACGTGSCG